MKNISSKDNAMIKYCIKLASDKKTRVEDGCFFAEGEKMVREAILHHIPITAFFYTQQSQQMYSSTVAAAIEWAEESYEISQGICAKLSDTKTPQGLFAVVHYLPEEKKLDRLSRNSNVLILENLQDPGNVGTILRTALAFSVDLVVLCGCCDLYSPKLLRSTVGTLFHVPFVRCGNMRDLIGTLHEKEIHVVATALHKDAKQLHHGAIEPGTAVIIGNEGAGVTNETLELCDDCLYIPMNPDAESLNAATAATVIMWEMKK